MMKNRCKFITLTIAYFSIAFWFVSYPVCATEITIVGEVNDSYQIVADGQIYEIADTEIGNDLGKNYISEKVEVTGTIEEKDEIKIIIVKSFKVVTK